MIEKKDWSEYPLAALTSKIGSGSTPRGGSETYSLSGIPFIRSMNVGMRQFRWEGLAYIDQATHEAMGGTHVQPNDVLLNITGASIGRVTCAPLDLLEGNVNQHVAIIRPTEALNPRYLMYWLSQPKLQEMIMGTQKGATRQALTKAQIEEIRIPLPALDEQRRIVARIDALAAKIEEARGLRRGAGEEAESLRATLSKKVFDGDSQAPIEKLAGATIRITKGESPEWQGFSYQESGPLFIRSENVLWGTLDLSKQAHIPVEFHQKLSRSQLRAGDVLINLVGASIGRSCVVPSDIGEANVNQAVAVISPDTSQLDSNYLMHFLISVPTQEILQGGKVETARPNISLGDLRDLEVPIPPIDEQRRIVAYLDDLQAKADVLKQLQAEAAAELEALLPSVLDQAFRGVL